MAKPKQTPLQPKFVCKSQNLDEKPNCDKFANINSFTSCLHDAFCCCAVAVDFGVDGAKLAQTSDVELLPAFGHLFQCCICYEDALICAIGNCNHILCVKCALKFATIYSRNRSYTCPYCSSVHALVFVGPNFNFVALALYRRVFERSSYLNGSYRIVADDLIGILKILNWSPRRHQDDNVVLQWRGKESVTTADLINAYLARIKAILNVVYESFPREVLNLVVRNGDAGGGVRDKQVAATIDWAREIYTGGRGTLHANGLRLVPHHRLVFADESCFWLYKRLTSFVCWMPQCIDRSRLTPAGGAGARPTDPSEAATSADSKPCDPFPTFVKLNQHLRHSHSLLLCNICFDYFLDKRFIAEMCLYGLDEIKRHTRLGDELFEAHVMCPVCGIWLWDRGCLCSHAKECHLQCEACDLLDGENIEVFADYNELREHHNLYHYPCMESDCPLVVYTEYIQLKLHYASQHPGLKVPLASTKRAKRPEIIQSARRRTPAASSGAASGFTVADFDEGAKAFDGTFKIVAGAALGTSSAAKEAVKTRVGPEKCDDSVAGTPSVLRVSPDEYGYRYVDADADADASASTEVPSHMLELPKDPTSLQRDLPLLVKTLGTFKSFGEDDYTKCLPVDVFNALQHVNTLGLATFKSLVQVAAKTGTSQDPNAIVDYISTWTFKILCLCYNADLNGFENNVSPSVPKSVQQTLQPNAPKVSLNGMAFLYQINNVVSKLTNVLVAKAALSKALEDVKVQLAQAALEKASLDVEKPAEVKSKKRGKAKQGDKLPLDALDRRNSAKPKQTSQTTLQAGATATATATLTAAETMTATKANSPGESSRRSKSKNAARSSTKSQNAVKDDKANATRHLVHLPLEPGSQYVDAKDTEADATEIEPPSKIVDARELLIDRMERVNFYGALGDAVYKTLIDNKIKNGAKVCQYSLRCTTRAKLEYMAMEKSQSLSNLSELLSASLLERLEALEPEFHRLAKKAKESSFEASVLDHWNRRCNEALKKCKVEQLEILDYWLRASIGAMALANATEFPSLTGASQKAPLGNKRLDYARALNLGGKTQVGAQFTKDEFPSLG